MRPEDILPTYQRVAQGYAKSRSRTLFERRWLDRMLAVAPGRRVLDLGCGPGRPIGAYLSDRRARLVAVDGAPAMLALYGAAVPEAELVEADMRGLRLGRKFDAILAWNSFFHLSPTDQRVMFATFAAHAAPGAALMFTAGPRAGEPVGQVQGQPVYHASLDPEDYRACLAAAGFREVAFVPEDPDCQGHSVWLARFVGVEAVAGAPGGAQAAQGAG